MKWLRRHVFGILDVVKFVLMAVLFLMFLSFNVRIGEQANAARETAVNTNDIVKSQADILTAIKHVTEDTRTTAAEQTAIIICMLQVPIPNRTTDLQADCRKQATGDAGSSEHISSSSASSARPGSSPQRISADNPGQSDNSQPGFLQRTFNPLNSLLNDLQMRLTKGVKL